MIYKYAPQGVCSREMQVEIDDEGKIVEAIIVGGCNGNSKGIMQLVKGRNAEEVIELLKNVECGNRGTSCPAQLAQCLEEALELM